jgi:glutamine phosphoribosylpyrophosphate amidotransferase
MTDMCCLFGIIDYKNYFNKRQKNRILRVLAKESEARGTDATGIAYNTKNTMKIVKAPLPSHKIKFNIPDVPVIMGHTRMTTQGSEKKNRNNHPFLGYVKGDKFALAHNGVINNEVILRRTQNLPNTNIQTDSYVAVQLLQKQNALDFDSLKYMAEKVEGSFCFTLLDSLNNIYVVKGSNPFCLYHFEKEGFYLYASTESILNKAISKLRVYVPKRYERIDISSGDIIKITCEGNIVTGKFNYCEDMWMWEGCSFYFKDDSAFAKTEHRRLEEIKWMASCFGYEPEEVEALYNDGYTLDEVEEFLYQ